MLGVEVGQDRGQDDLGCSFQGLFRSGVQAIETVVLALERLSWWLVLRGLGWK